ncbi:MAG: carbohydrate ABC transporter permease [Alphaproteobacteria bacterium]
MRGQARSLLADMPRLAVLGLIGLVMLSPYIWMVSASLKPLDELFRATLNLVPQTFHGHVNYGRVFAEVPVVRYILNGIIVCAGILAFQLAFAIPAGYAIAKLRFRGRDTLFAFVMLGLLVPAHVPALPLYVAFAQIGILNTYAALIAPFVSSVFAVFMFRQFFRSIPDDLINAARVDGMTEASIVWRVVLPNAWPAATAFAIFSVVAHWNDLFWPLIVVNGHSVATPALGILYFRTEEAGDDFGALMAAAVIMTTPLVAAFLLAQRRFIEGITMTGLKG